MGNLRISGHLQSAKVEITTSYGWATDIDASAFIHFIHFHYINDEEKPLQRVLSEYLYDATFVVAANLLAGHEISGFGLSNLRDCAQHGPISRLSEVGVLANCAIDNSLMM